MKLQHLNKLHCNQGGEERGTSRQTNIVPLKVTYKNTKYHICDITTEFNLNE